ncbi:MAG: hypothetical protein ABSH48_27910 [Verrucomicrobiota bacterium]|jgi:hypothetical protein
MAKPLITLPANGFHAIFTSSMSADRYFVNSDGAVTRRMRARPGDGHISIAREVLPTMGIVPKDDADLYDQMFRLKFIRIVEHDDDLVVVEHTCKLTTDQKRYLQSLTTSGKKLVYISVKRRQVA